jgi:hypothetical protein
MKGRQIKALLNKVPATVFHGATATCTENDDNSGLHSASRDQPPFVVLCSPLASSEVSA